METWVLEEKSYQLRVFVIKDILRNQGRLFNVISLFLKLTIIFKSTKKDSCMIAPEQLYKSIPKKVEQWDAKDVQKWFSINNFQTRKEFSFQEQKFDGKALIATSPEYLLSACGVASRLIMRKIIEWLEYDREEFEEYVEEHPAEEAQEELKEFISHSKPASTQYIFGNSEDHALQDLPTQKNKENAPYRNFFSEVIKHQESILPIMEVQKWKKKKPLSEESILDKKSVSKSNLQRLNNKSESYIPNGASFIQSSYQIRHSLLQFDFEKQIIILQHSGKIGRQINNDVIIVSESVSRHHAEVYKDKNEFFIKDVGSKFGTFIEIGKPDRNVLSEGDIIAFEDSEIEIMKFKYYKGQNVFDLKIRKECKQKFQSFIRKDIVAIGREQGSKKKDIEFSDPRIQFNHASITVEPSGKLIIRKEDGICFRKLRINELFKIQENDKILRLGLTQVKIRIVHNHKPVPNVSEFAPERF